MKKDQQRQINESRDTQESVQNFPESINIVPVSPTTQNARATSVKSKSSKSTVSATLRRQRLEVQLEYERMKKQKEQEIIGLELALKLAELDEENESKGSSYSTVSAASIAESKHPSLKQWIEKQNFLNNKVIEPSKIIWNQFWS